MAEDLQHPPPPNPSAGSMRRLGSWLFRDRATGRIVIAQAPNLALWLFLATVVLGWLISSSTANAVIRGFGTAALAWWALDEVIRGVNPWRRLLGVAGCVLVIARLAG